MTAPPPDDEGFAPDGDGAVLGAGVSADRQGYWVELTTGFADDVVRCRIGPYRTERIAVVAAHHIRRAAGREAPPRSGFQRGRRS